MVDLKNTKFLLNLVLGFSSILRSMFHLVFCTMRKSQDFDPLFGKEIYIGILFLSTLFSSLLNNAYLRNLLIKLFKLLELSQNFAQLGNFSHQ